MVDMEKLKKYKKMGFNSEQLDEIHLGFEQEVDVSIYADPKFDYLQMDEVRLGLEKGIDVSLYADPKYNEGQMSEIRWGLQKGVDINVYADPKFDSMRMNQIRTSLSKGCDVSKILDANLTYEEMEEIINKEKPSVRQFLKNFNITNDGKKAIFYKAVRKLNETMFASIYNRDFTYEIGETAVEPDVDRNVNETCSEGIHVSSLAWAKNFARHWDDSSFVEVEVDIDDIVLPLNTDGKVRVSHAKVLREVF